MIQANELRIGNLVNHNISGVNFKIISYHFNELFSDPNKPAINPIPLTEEWLLRFGFEIRKGSVLDSFYIGINPVTHDWLFDIVWLKNMIDYSYEGFPFYKNGHFTIKHVHQLQNLYFALTGEELTLKT